MAINGEAFLRLNKQNCLTCTEHAVERLFQHTGMMPDDATLTRIFLTARQVKYREMKLMGFRPNFLGRRARKRHTWYFHAVWQGVELILVLSKSSQTQVPVWVTTYTRDRQCEQYAVLNYDELESVA